MSMNQDNQTPRQNDNFAAGGEEFVFTEERKPVNRNLMVLLMIAVVGGGMVYLMYLRSSGSGGLDDEATRAKSQQVADFVQKGQEDLKKLEERLKQMDSDVAKATGDNGANQVKTEDLKTNPFQFEKAAADPTPRVDPGPFVDERQAIARVAAKAQIQMISYSARGSTCILNSKLCSEGDQVTIEGVTFTLKQIAQDYIMLEHKLGSYKVTVNKGL